MTGTNLIALVQRIFATADQLHLDEWLTYFAEDARFRFGNAEFMTGREAIYLVMAQFFSVIKAMHHAFNGMYQQDNIVIAEAMVTFTRLDDNVVYIPATTIFRMQDDRVQDFRLYMDAAPLFT